MNFVSDFVSFPAACHQAIKSVTEHFRLPFHRQTWHGTGGNWQGSSAGSSIDFQDHRPYLPGDDPRYINWQAYARTGHYTMKLYREEVSPAVDLVLDFSRSMFLTEAKAQKSFELFYFCLESALQINASLHCFLITGSNATSFPNEKALAYNFPTPSPTFQAVTHLESVPWRNSALRIFISDLLYPLSETHVLAPLSRKKGLGIIFAPFANEEVEPDWQGNVEFEDCESVTQRFQNVTAQLLTGYKHAYGRHFELWKEAAYKHRVLMARLPSNMSFPTSLQQEALRNGAVSAWT